MIIIFLRHSLNMECLLSCLLIKLTIFLLFGMDSCSSHTIIYNCFCHPFITLYMVYSLFKAALDKSGLVKYFKVGSLVCCVLLSHIARSNTDETFMQYRVCGNSLDRGSTWGT